VLLGLVGLSQQWSWGWLGLLPWLAWLWQGLGLSYPVLNRQGWYSWLGWSLNRASGLALVGLGGFWLGQQLGLSEYGSLGAVVGVSLVGEANRPSVEVREDESGVYQVQLRGEFSLRVDGQVEMYKRLLIIFLGLLEVAGENRSSRRTRDGRRPFVRQEQLSLWFGEAGPNISRWGGDWLKQDWRRLLSQRWGEVLTAEVQQEVLHSWIKFPWWSAEQLWNHLPDQGSRLSLNQVKQVAQESGWSLVRQELKQVYRLTAESFRPQQEWLTEQLLAQLQSLTEQLAQLGQLPAQVAVDQADLLALSRQLELQPVQPPAPNLWLRRVEAFLFGDGSPTQERVRCCYCGTSQVSAKSNQPRLKHYQDEQGQMQSVEVYRYYCHNPACSYGSFTHLPPHLLPYSRFSLKHHLAALQLYEWSQSVYRCTGQWLGVSKMTAYRWVSSFGYELLPAAALFGLVRSSGVVGVDEKYVKVAQPSQPNDSYNGWMYVYVAVDCYSYDLLHIEIYPGNGRPSALAFLLALPAKGYQPRVVVTDLRVDYHELIAQVFPQASHHECIFHALKELHHHFRQVYGPAYPQSQPQVEALRLEIDRIFQAQTKRTAHRRYDRVLAQRQTFVSQTAEAEAIFAFLERHWPRLVNAIDSPLIPTTNNATEQVIRHFNQHYKTFGGFQNIASARLYLALFEKVYRFTPFSNDAHRSIRGKSPLELAGYDLQNLPIALLFRGFLLHWPPPAFQELVPNV
jgi:transposase-like protein